jgi:2-dehydropantoate 2-reductase
VRVVVLGAGSLGSLYAAWSADAGHEVTLVARPAHAAAVNAHGLTVRDRDGTTRLVPMRAVSDAAAIEAADVVLMGAKAQDTAALLAALPDAVQPLGAWSIQNGAGQAEPLVERFGAAAIGCSSMVGATLTAPGAIDHTFTGSTYIGALPTSAPDAVDAVQASLAPAAQVVVRDDIVSVLWSKAVLAVGAMGMTTLLRLPYHHVFVHADAREVFYDLVADAARVAAALGIPLVDLPGPLQAGSLMALPRAEALDRLAAVGDAMVANGQTQVIVSMLQSVQTGRRLEVEAVFGHLLDRGTALGLDLPLLTAVTRIVRTLDEVARDATSSSP